MGNKHTGNLLIAQPTLYSADEFSIRHGVTGWMGGYLILTLNVTLNTPPDREEDTAICFGAR